MEKMGDGQVLQTIQLKVGVSGVYILVSEKACKAETKYYEIDV